jgi:hypothetical protein
MWRRTTIGLAILVLLLIPIRTTVAPAWPLRVLDDSGQPVSDAMVRQVWLHNGADAEHHEAVLRTGRGGSVRLPARKVTASSLQRAINTVRAWSVSSEHTIRVRASEVYVWKPGYTDGFASLVPGEPLASTITLRRARVVGHSLR